jgi:hypothetical protein
LRCLIDRAAESNKIGRRFVGQTQLEIPFKLLRAIVVIVKVKHHTRPESISTDIDLHSFKRQFVLFADHETRRVGDYVRGLPNVKWVLRF